MLRGGREGVQMRRAIRVPDRTYVGHRLGHRSIGWNGRAWTEHILATLDALRTHGSPTVGMRLGSRERQWDVAHEGHGVAVGVEPIAFHNRRAVGFEDPLVPPERGDQHQ